MLFDGPPAELPIATLSSTRLPRRHRMLGDLDRWLSLRWAWLSARAIPLAVAAAGLFATLGAVKYAGLWARGSHLALGVHSRTQATPPRELMLVRHGHPPTQIVVRPIAPTDHYVVLTIDPPDAP